MVADAGMDVVSLHAHCQQECELVTSLEIHLDVSQRAKLELPCDPAISLLGIN